MSKSVKITGLILAAFMLGGCANTTSDAVESGNPFDETKANETDNYEEMFGKYQVGSFNFSNYSIEGGSVIEYNGGNIELSFDTDTSGNQYDVEFGYMGFINGVPQKLSLNGGESNELVCVSQAPDQKKTVTLSFTPAVSKELSGESTLQLKLISIFNPSYKPSGSFKAFGNAHVGRAFFESSINVNSPLEVSENLTALTECESMLITDEVVSQYGVKKPKESTPTNVFIADAQTNEEKLTLRDGRIDANLLIYGNELYNYRVYVYVNHSRVKFNGCDYLDTEIKSGYLNVLKLELENIGERDIVYAVAVPVDSETGKMNVRKSSSVLVLNENDVQDNIGNIDTEGGVETAAETKDPLDKYMDTDIYNYQPVGYIDEEQRYLLLSNPRLYGEMFCYDYITYDETLGKVIGTLNIEHNLSFSYGGGVLTVKSDYWDDGLNDGSQFTVYNEKLELIKEIRNDMPYTYCPKYDPLTDCWYYLEGDGLCRANGDFTNITRLTDFDMRDYYITDDRIVYYRTIYDYSKPDTKADIFGIMDLDGNVIEETKVASYGSGHFRIGKAGDYIYFLSPLMFNLDGVIEPPMEGMIFYNIKTKETKTIYPEEYNENSYCCVTPNGKYLVTGVIVKENHYTYLDHIIKLYDIESGELIKSEGLIKSESVGMDLHFNAMWTHNDRVILAGRACVTYKFG